MKGTVFTIVPVFGLTLPREALAESCQWIFSWNSMYSSPKLCSKNVENQKKVASTSLGRLKFLKEIKTLWSYVPFNSLLHSDIWVLIPTNHQISRAVLSLPLSYSLYQESQLFRPQFAYLEREDWIIHCISNSFLFVEARQGEGW